MTIDRTSSYARRKLSEPPPKKSSPSSAIDADAALKSPRILTGEQLSGATGASASSWYLQRGRGNPIGPFTTEEVREGVAAGEIPHDALAREIAETAWRPLGGIAEFRDVVMANASGDAARMDAERLAPVEGPKWTSRAERHVGRREGGGVGASAHSSHAPPPSREVASRSQPPKKPASIPSRVYEPPPAAHRFVAAALAALGSVWTLCRATILLKLPEGWASLVEQHHALRAAVVAEIAVGAVVWPLLLVGALGSGGRRLFGTPLVRAAAWTTIALLTLVAVVAPVMVSRDATWSIDPAKVFVVAVASAAPAMLACCAAWVLRLFPEDEDGPRFPSLAAIIAAVAAALGALLLYAWPDVVYVFPVGDEPALVFTDVGAARDDAEGRRLGVAGVFERRRAQASSFTVAAGTPARYLDETHYDLESGPVVVRAIALFDGSESGRVVYVSSEALRSRP